MKDEVNNTLSGEKPSIYLQLGRQIKMLRIKAKYSQDDLAEYVGLPRYAVVCIETGKRKVDIVEYFKLMFLLEPSFPKDLSASIILQHLTGINITEVDALTEEYLPKEKLKL
jgi:DNA-binding XRE family transcriptional regulator